MDSIQVQKSGQLVATIPFDSIEPLTFSTFQELLAEHIAENKSLILGSVETELGSRIYFYYAPLFIKVIYRLSQEDASQVVYRIRIKNPLTNTKLKDAPVNYYAISDGFVANWIGDESYFSNGLIRQIKNNALNEEDCVIPPLIRQPSQTPLEEFEEQSYVHFKLLVVVVVFCIAILNIVLVGVIAAQSEIRVPICTKMDTLQECREKWRKRQSVNAAFDHWVQSKIKSNRGAGKFWA